MMSKILALWAHPRARSTAFARMMVERGDFFVIDEPFGRYYYFSDERISHRRSDVEPQPESSFDAIWQGLLQKNTFFSSEQAQPIFIKEQACYVTPRADQAFLSHFENTFLIRHPAQSLPSQFALMPDFTLQETGYAESYRLFELAKTVSGRTPVVIDADDLVQEPSATIQAYCEAVGIPFLPQALSWNPGLPSNFAWWEAGSWHSQVKSSRGFKKSTKSNYVSVDDNEHLRQAYDFCLPYYEKLYEHRIRIGLCKRARHRASVDS